MSIGETLGLVFGVLGGIAAIAQIVIWIRNYFDDRVEPFSSIERNGVRLLDQITASGFRPDFVLCLGRSGALVGGWLAGNLGVEHIGLIDRIVQDDATKPMEFPAARELLEAWKKLYGEGAKILVVQGAATRGQTYINFRKLQQELVGQWNCKFCAMYKIETADAKLDYCARTLKHAPKKYPWKHTSAWRDSIIR